MSDQKSSSSYSETEQRSWFTRFLDAVEWLGNLLPHPVTLFALFATGVILLSGLAEWLNWYVEDPRPEGAEGRAEDGTIEAVSLMNEQGFQRILANLVDNFTGFAPLGVVLVALLGVGVAEHSGLIKSGIRGLVLSVLKIKPQVYDKEKASIFRRIGAAVLDPRKLVTIAIVFGGIISNTASELGYVVLVPLGAVVFYSVGRHPLAGLAAAFASVSGGYSANIFLGTIDPLLAGLTEEAARLIDPGYSVHAAVNWYFMIISTFMITAVATFVTLRIVEPKLGTYDPEMAMEDLSEYDDAMDPLTDLEKRGLFWAFISFLFFLGVILFLTIPEWGWLREPETGEIIVSGSPLLEGIVALIFIGFIIPGYVYGRVAGTMKSDRDVIEGMAKSMSTLGLYIVIVFFAAQFVAFFDWTNLGQIFAVNGAQLLENLGMTGPFIFIAFIMVSGFVNLMLGSASAQWAVTAPIFVPMLMLIGYSPEVIQTAYRIGDSVTNIVTPMMTYFGLILAFANRYDKNLGIGTVIAMMLPYSIFFLLSWIVLFMVWVFGFGFEVGPGSPTYYGD